MSTIDPTGALPQPQRPSMLGPVLITGTIFGVLNLTPFAYLNLLCCLPLFGCGAMAAWLHSRSLGRAGEHLTPGLGALAGTAAGGLSGVVTTAVDFLLLLSTGDPVGATEERMDRTAESMPFGTESLDSLPEGWPLVILVVVSGLVFSVAFGAGFGALGGTIVGALRKKPEPPFPGQAPPPPPKVFD